VYRYDTKECFCICSGRAAVGGFKQALSLTTKVNVHLSGLPVDRAAKFVEKIVPGKVGIPASVVASNKKVTLRVQNKTLRQALVQAGFWTR